MDACLFRYRDRPFDSPVTFGRLPRGIARLEDAVTTYRNVLKKLKEPTHEIATPQDMGFAWAQTQMNLGASLRALGARTGSTARVEEAIAAYRDALTEFTRDRSPRKWAEAQNGLGAVLATLAEREGGRARLEDAVIAFREALNELPSDPHWHQIVRQNLMRAVAELERRARL